MKNTSKKLAVGLLTTTIVASQVFPTSLSLFPEQTKGIEAEATLVYISPNPTVTDTGGSLRVNFNINVLSTGGYVRMEIFRPTNPSSAATSGGRILDTFNYVSYPTYKGDYTVYLEKRVAAEKGDVVRITYFSKSGTELGIAATNAFATGYLSAATTALIDDAKSKVGALFTDTTKTTIKTTTNQAAIDAAQSAVDKLPAGTDKTNLQNDINKAKTLLADKIANENTARTAVDALFTDTSKTAIKPLTDQAAIDAAQALVNKVTDPTVKAALQADINKAQSLLNAKNAAVAEKAKQDSAKKAVDELFNNNDPSSNAIKPVTDQAAIDASQKLVDAVTDPTVKAALQADVDKAQDLLDARIQADKDQKAVASYLVNQLFQNNTPSSDAIKPTTDQAGIDNAQAEINKIVDPVIKAELQSNLDRAQELLDQRIATVAEQAKQDAAKRAVDELFNNNTPSSNAIKPVTDQAAIDAAQALVNKVTDPTVKAALQADVDKAQSLLDAKNGAAAVEQAKQDAAKKAVDELFSNNTPSSNAIKPVTDQAAIDAAQVLVNRVTDPTAKAALQADVDKAQNLLDAKNVAAAEQAKQDAAKKAVDELFNNNTPSSNAIKPVTDQAAIDAAQALVNKVTDPTVKAALQANVDKAQSLLDAKNAARKAVDELFNNNTPSSNAIKPVTDQAAIDAAQALVNKVTDPTVKAALQADVDKAQSLLDAKNATAAEKANQDAARTAVNELFNNNTPSSNAIKPVTDQKAIDAAQALVNKVTDPTTKAALQADVNKAQSLLDAKNAAVTKPVLDAYHITDEYITGKVDANTATVELYINGVRSKISTPTNGEFKLYAQSFGLKVGDTFEVRPVDAKGNKGPVATGTVLGAALNLTTNDAGLSATTVTGTVGAGITSVRLSIDGTIVKVGQINADGTYSIATNNLIKPSSKVEVVGYVDKTEMVRKAVSIVNDEKPVLEALTIDDDTVKGSVTAGSATSIRISINGVAKKTANIAADGTFESNIGKQPLGTVVTVEVRDSAGYNSYRTASVTVTGSAVAKLAAPTLTKMDGGYIVGTAPKGTETIVIYEDGAAARTQKVSDMTVNPDGSFTFKAYVAASASTVQVQAKNSDKRMNSDLSAAFTK
ncbi:toxin Cry1Ac domain D-VI-related protein [Listeria booriae]|uniref:toxin Cry1Ac domain D-VI-related protein n=2 Tax=Listeria booriae TaxID=1552123 RepID=UPI0016280E76|nr:toxin Cry1Ac domain D-VI-related protein [Listeria booriae]MBC1358012.1 hypothetical protein [Listeria booriae]